MKIIILGSGDVSLELAKYLVDAGHAVTIADTASDKLAEIANRIDLRVVVGNPASPETLRKAGAKNTELLVATTSDDETNITACSVAHFLFKTTRTIARLRAHDYLEERNTLFGKDGIPIDHIIATEDEVTKIIKAKVDFPGINAFGSFCNGSLVVVSTKVTADGKLCGKLVADFNKFDAADAVVMAIYRKDENGREKYVSKMENEVFVEGDEVFYCCIRENIKHHLRAFRALPVSKRYITIAGGTHIADYMARILSENYRIKLIEADPQRAKRSAINLHSSSVQVFNADPTDMDFILEENLDKTDLYIAATPTDETNIMSSLIMRRMHNVQTAAIIKSEGYLQLSDNERSEIGTVILPKESIISAMLTSIRQEGVESVSLFRQGKAEAIEFILEGTKSSSKIIGKKASDLNLPKGVTLGLVKRERKFVRVDENFVFAPKDHVIAFLDDHTQMRKLVKMFRPDSFWIPSWL